MIIELTSAQANLILKAVAGYHEKLAENKSKTQDIQLLTFYSEEIADSLRITNLINKEKEAIHGS